MKSIRKSGGLLLWLTCVALCASAQGGPSKVKDGFIDTEDSVRIHYLESGVQTRSPTLLLIPGWRFPARIWKSQIEHFSTRERVIAIDPRSQGESTKTTEGNTPEVRARDLHRLIEQLALPQVVLVGWSQGVQDVAAYVAEFGTDRMAGIVFVDSSVSAGPAQIELRKDESEQELGMLALFSEHPLAYSRGMMPFMFKHKQDDAYVAGLVNDSLKTPTSTAVSMLVTDMFTIDRRPVLSKITKPMLIVAAADSPEFDAQKDMKAKVAGSEFVSMEGVGHAVFVDDADQFNQILEKFLTTIDRAH